MIYYYHPILGLSYYTCEEEIFLISMLPDVIPQKTMKEFTDEFKKWQSEVGVQWLDTKTPKIEQIHFPIISNF